MVYDSRFRWNELAAPSSGSMCAHHRTGNAPGFLMQPLPRPLRRLLLFGLLLLCGAGCSDLQDLSFFRDRGTTSEVAAVGRGSGGGRLDIVSLLSASGYPAELMDDDGRMVFLDRAPTRILSLVPSATEILLALAGPDLLVGRTEYDLDPRIADLPSVGGGLEPSMERVVALSPDLVIHFLSETDLTTPRMLDAAGIPRLVVRPDNIGDIRRITAMIGRSLDRGVDAARLIVAIDRELNEISETVRSAPRTRSAFLLGGDPPLVAGKGTYLHELIEIAGGENVFAEVGALYAPVSLETFVQRRVETVLVLGEAGAPASFAAARIPVHIVAAQLPGLAVGAHAREIAKIFHPELFP